MRTPTGDYRIDHFNKYGERIDGASAQASSLMESHQKAADLKPADAHSYTVMRCVFNSLDSKYSTHV
jgi:hypothetical protein